MKPSFPSIDLAPEYPLHDKDGFLTLAAGMWVHTQHLVGKPTRDEVETTLKDFPRSRRDQALAWLARHRQLDDATAFAVVTQGAVVPVDLVAA
jgi:hypothetical protein